MAFMSDNSTLGQFGEYGNSTSIGNLWKNAQPAEILGIVLSIFGSFLISISLNLQKYTHVRLACRQDPLPYYKSKLWWFGMFLMGAGELGNFAAYGFAPATLIAPLGCVAVIGSAAISVVFLKETLRPSDIVDYRNNNLLRLAVFPQTKGTEPYCGFAAAGVTAGFIGSDFC
ncbi:NIPA-like protein 2 [Xenopus tropicalis]|uniref:MGC89520 protein n=1 Tax=Xenopus tropicalis TaxID=8364 RepID=Q6DEW5_XENTR|eukprot:NP_001005069.1 NIPA-like protein 2 [Xenopus tropicalis]